MKAMIKRALHLIADSVFTARCDICGEVIEVGAARCDACISAKRVEGEACLLCGKEKKDCTCKEHIYSKPRFDSFYAPYYYQGSIASGVRKMKQSSYTELTAAMGKETADFLRSRRAEIDFDCVTFVPLTKRKEKRRGYNQAQLIAEVVARELGIPSEKLLCKIFNTDSQRLKNSMERRGNVFGIFDLAPGADVDGKRILIIDDVKTTGSTLSECADMLKIYGAEYVCAASFAVR